jgi:hypothetical protein
MMRFTAICVGLMLMLSTAGCAESNFELSPESRIPAWFTIPRGLSRGDVTISLTYYTGPSVKFKLWDSHGRNLAEVSGLSSLEPYPSGPKTPGGGVDERSYPLYEIVRANGITEVIEHRRQFDRWFYITDDPEIKRKLGL